MSDYQWIDECFQIEKNRCNTWKSFNRNEENILTSLTEDTCIDATRFYLKEKQEEYIDSKS